MVRTPTTFCPSTSRDSAGKPVKRFTPSASASFPSQRTISQIDAMKFPWFFMEDGVGIRQARFRVRT